MTDSVPDGASLIRGNRLDRPAFEASVRAGRFDVAFDMICFTREDALSGIRAFKDIQQIIHCSSVATYGRRFKWFPTTEDHPLAPTNEYGRGKADADQIYLEAFMETGFPVAILKPSISYGPKSGLLRQIGNNFSWLDRIRQGKPLIVSGDGIAVHQFMHVDDVARGFLEMIGRVQCAGETYNLVQNGCTSWNDYHLTAMDILGKSVELIGVPAKDIVAASRIANCPVSDVFSHNSFFSSEKYQQAIPQFLPKVSLKDGMAQVIEALEREGRIPKDEDGNWEDQLIESQGKVITWKNC
jgi:nucleoside-diphosphate-sugar epimerase